MPDALPYDPRWDGVDEATAMEWERESQDEPAVLTDDDLAGEIDPEPW